MVATGNFWVLAALARMKILISGTVWSLPNRDAATQKAQTQGAHEKGKRLSSLYLVNSACVSISLNKELNVNLL